MQKMLPVLIVLCETAKSQTLAPVMYTLRKYVRKPKGFLPGKVIVEKEDVILVEPSPPQKL